MRRLTMTYEDNIYYPILKIAKDSNKTFRDVVMTILDEYLYKTSEIEEVKSLYNMISECKDKVDKISKKQNMHYDLSVQEFVNHGYLSNADPNESVSYQSLINKNNRFND